MSDARYVRVRQPRATELHRFAATLPAMWLTTDDLRPTATRAYVVSRWLTSPRFEQVPAALARAWCRRDSAATSRSCRWCGLSGAIGISSPLKPGLTLADVARSLDRAFSMRNVRAVALSINSPGGAAAQSHLIHRRIRALADEKKIPVIAFVEDVAASGGYMIACAADEIVADASSIVGSIGVVGGSFGFDKLIEKIGIERRLYTSGENKAMLDPFLPEKPEDVERLKAMQREIHESFIALVKDAARRQARQPRNRLVLRGILDRSAGPRTRPCRCRRRSAQRVARALRRQGANAADRGARLLFGRRAPGVSRAVLSSCGAAEPRRRHGCDARGARIMVALRTVGGRACLCSLWALGAIGAVVLIKLFNREWQRVNDELDRANPVRVERSRARRRADVAPAIPRPASTGGRTLERQLALLDALVAHDLAPALVFVLEELAESRRACRPPAPRRSRSASASPPDR